MITIMKLPFKNFDVGMMHIKYYFLDKNGKHLFLVAMGKLIKGIYTKEIK